MLDTPSQYSPTKATGAALAYIGYSFLLGVVIFLMVSAAGGRLGLDASNPVLIGVGSALAAFLVLRRALARAGANWSALLESRPLPLLVHGVALFALVPLTIVLSELSNWVGWVIPVPASLAAMFESLSNLAQFPIAAPLAVVVLAPVVEEVFCRGYLLRRLLSSVSPAKAIWTSALLFGFIHLNPWQFVTATLIGLFLGWVYLRTRSLLLCILLHAANNAGSILSEGLPFKIRGFNVPQTEVIAFQPWWFTTLGLIGSVAAICWLNRIMPSRPIQEEPEQGGSQGTYALRANGEGGMENAELADHRGTQGGSAAIEPKSG